MKLFLLTLIFGCGIPSFDYIDGANVIDNNSDYILESEIDLSSSPLITGFTLYSRYYTETQNSKYFESLEISDISNGSEQYLKDLGYTVVTYSDSDNDSISIGSTVELLIKDDDLSTVLILSDAREFILHSSYSSENINFFHTIGSYSDEEGAIFLNDYTNDLDDVNIATIKIEFSIINKGISSDFEHLESVPVYLGTLEIDTLQ